MPKGHLGPRAVINLPSLCREFTEPIVRVLAAYVKGKIDAPPAARIEACKILLERGWGRVPQNHTIDAEGDLRVTIRHIVEGYTPPVNGHALPEPTTIDVTPEAEAQ